MGLYTRGILNKSGAHAHIHYTMGWGGNMGDRERYSLMGHCGVLIRAKENDASRARHGTGTARHGMSVFLDAVLRSFCQNNGGVLSGLERADTLHSSRRARQDGREYPFHFS